MGTLLLSTEQLPGNFGIPLLGETVELFSQQELFYSKRFQLYGSHFKTRVMGKKIACLVGPDANQFVLKSGADNFSSRMGWSILEPLLGRGILLQDGEEHLRVRKLMYPAFHYQSVEEYFDIIQNTVEEFLQDWSQRSPFFLHTQMRKLTLLIACRLLLRIEDREKVETLVQYFLELIAGIRAVIRVDIPPTKFGRAMKARRQIEIFLNSVIQSRRKGSKSGELKDILGLLLNSTDEEGNSLKDAEIFTQSIQLLFGAHETTAKFLSWTLFQLNSRPEWKNKLKDELTTILNHEALKYYHLKNLTWMGYVLKEVERLYPPLYSIPRGVIRDCEYAGYLIPKGWYVVLSPLLTHRLRELYLEPHEFQPERFAPPREEDKKHPFALIGFGGGAHRCLGYEVAQMQAKIFLSTLLNFYDWKIVADVSSTPNFSETNKVEKKMRFWCEKVDSPVS